MLKQFRQWFLANRLEVALVIILFVVAAIPRLTGLGEFLTADEKNWIGRSYEFVRAFKDWRFNDMLQTTHPGVITLWLSGVTVTAKMFLSHIPFSFRNMVHFVAAAQFPIALFNAVMVPVIYLLLRQLTRNRAIPFLASLVIALDPFIVGYSRVVHVDALLMSFVFAAALALLVYMDRGWSRRWLIIAGVLAGLAVLTKAPAVFLLPYFILIVLVGEGRNLWQKQVLVARIRDLVLWLLVIGILFVTIWPAILWVPNPEGNVLLLKRDIGRAAITPHHMSQDYTVDSSFYVGTLLTRTTPVILGLVGLMLVWLLLRSRKSTGSIGVKKRILWLLVAYVIFFGLMMMLGAKKGDRYILPVFPALDLLAVVGLLGFGGLIFNLQFSIFKFQRKSLQVVLAGALVLYLGITIVRYHPYEIAYSSPIFPDNLSQELGWGEGLEQVGRWMNETSPEAVVASWYPEELGAYTRAQVAHINAHEQGKVRYVVLYRNMFGRAADHPANDFIDEYYKKRDPVFTAKVVGKEFAWVYEKPVYERVVGELTRDRSVEQEVEITRPDLVGFEVLVATYSGQAQAGDLIVQLRDGRGGDVIHSWSKPVSQLEDNHWERFDFPKASDRPIARDVSVMVFARGTSEGDAPTVRYTRDNNYRQSNVFVDGEEVAGDMAVRARYLVGDDTVLEEHTKLFR